ncbi:MAG TPA: hypothetical protein VNP98_11215 [Chthoniobacterales bacterium]|nr:hypothetical protein [Chthoniobacterales bacterium]
MKKPLTPVVVLVSLVTAIILVFFFANSIGAAEKSAGGVVIINSSRRAAPIKTVAEFDKAFTSRFNAAINPVALAAGGEVVDTYIASMNINTKFTKWETARKISKSQLEILRSQISATLKEASGKRTALSDIASGSIGNNFFEGKIVARKSVKTDVKTDVNADLKPRN